MKKELIKLANYLEKSGLLKEADYVGKLLTFKKTANNKAHLCEAVFKDFILDQKNGIDQMNDFFHEFFPKVKGGGSDDSIVSLMSAGLKSVTLTLGKNRKELDKGGDLKDSIFQSFKEDFLEKFEKSFNKVKFKMSEFLSKQENEELKGYSKHIKYNCCLSINLTNGKDSESKNSILISYGKCPKGV